MKYATGRGTRCKHSTSMEWDEVEKKQRRTGLRFSTGRNACIRHNCGIAPDEETSDKSNADVADKKGRQKTIGGINGQRK